jgi:hypothetical protein
MSPLTIADPPVLEGPDYRATGHTRETVMCDEWERKHDSEPAIFPSLLLTAEEVDAVNWDAVFAQW